MEFKSFKKGNNNAPIRFLSQPESDKAPSIGLFRRGFKKNGEFFCLKKKSEFICPSTFGGDCPVCNILVPQSE